MLNKKAQRLISSLGLERHPEGGYFKQVYQCPISVSTGSGQRRRLASSIYYLLPAGDVSRFHRLKSDELWYYHAGDPTEIHMIDQAGMHTTLLLGMDTTADEQPQAAVPAGNIFGAATKGTAGYSLLGCMVCPGFEYADFELIKQDALIKAYPQYKELILALT